MTDQLDRSSESLPPPEPTSRVDRLKGEIVSGGAVHEQPDDELAGGWQGALSMAVLAALFIWLATINLWWFMFAVGILISVVLHEAGHFLTARATGMKATQFFLFFGPRLWSFRRGETEYGVRAIPLGAFVRIIGMHEMDDGVAPEDESRTYRQKSFPRRLLVISGGSIMHMIIAVTLLFVVYLGQGERTDQFKEEVIVSAVTDLGPAKGAGVLPGDQVLSIGGTALADAGELGTVVREFEPQDVVDVVVLRDGQELTIPVALGARVDVPRDNELFGTALIGINQGNPWFYEDHSVVAAAGNAVVDVVPTAWESTKGVFKALNPVNVITHVTGNNDNIETRPVTLIGVTGLSDDVGDNEGFYGVLWLLAVLNVFVGVFNMFPLLPLDGGHAAIAVYERVREAMRGGKQRYFADVERLMPFAMGVVVVLLLFMSAGLWLDVTDPL